MSNEELLQAISDMMDQKLEEKLDQKLEEKLDKKLEEKLDQKLEEKLDKTLDQKLTPIYSRLDTIEEQYKDFHQDFKCFERNITKSVHTLQDEMETVITILKLNELVPQ